MQIVLQALRYVDQIQLFDLSKPFRVRLNDIGYEWYTLCVFPLLKTESDN